MNHYVYEITNLINGKKYIGKRSCHCPIEEDKYMGSGKLIKLAEKKYGIENFKKEVLCVCDSEEIAFELEKVYIEEVKAYSNSNYYNISSGGNGGFNNFAGKTEEELNLWKKRMGDSRKGRVITDEWKAKILKTRREKGIGVGSSNGMYGRKGGYSPVSKPLVMISLEGEYVREFTCAKEASEYVCGSKKSSIISRVCVAKEGTAYGYFWLHKEDYENMIRNHNYVNWIKYMINRYVLRLRESNRHKIQNNSKSVFKLDMHDLHVIEEYESIALASTSTEISRNSISRNCRHGCNSAGGFAWCFVEEYNNLSKEDLESLYSRKYTKPPKECYKGNKKSIICLNTNQVFDGMVDAVEYFNLCKGARIDAVCRGTRKSAGKHPETNEPLKWMYYEEYLNQYEISA